MAADRELLFGMLALQIGLIDQAQLVTAFQAWTRAKAGSLADQLAQRGDINPGQRAALEAMVAEHLKRLEGLHGGNQSQSLEQDGQGLRTSTLCGVETQAQTGALNANGTSDHTLTFIHRTVDATGGRYQLLRPHAKGGLGLVSVALDTELNREVALKQIQEQFADNTASRYRFLLEAEITGGLEHPGIVPVYGLGQDAKGRPFYAMRFVKGESLKQAIANFHGPAEGPSLQPHSVEWNLALRQLLNRFIAVCHVVAYAHNRGVLHRDLKPSNILLGAYGETLVVDWGLAKLMARTETGKETAAELTLRPGLSSATASGSSETLPGTAIGTPAYMSPEQAEGRLDEIGPACDVYGLGATLYTILTGRTPVPEGEIVEVINRVRRGEITPPRKIAHHVSPALEAICLKAVALKPEDRYASPSELAEDLEHWLADESVSVYRESLATGMTRWGRRNKGLAVGLGGLLIVAVVGLGLGTFLLGRANERTERQRLRADARASEAVEKAESLERQLYINRVNLALRDYTRDLNLSEQLLDLCPPRLRGWEWHYLKRLCHQDRFTLRGGAPSINAVAYSPDGRFLLSGGGKSWQLPTKEDTAELILWDAQTGREIRRFPGLQGTVHAVAFSPDSKTIAAGVGYYGQPVQVKGQVLLWETESGKLLMDKTETLLNPLSVTFSPDGKLLAAGMGIDMSEQVKGRLVIWDRTTGAETFRADAPPGGVTRIAFSPDGNVLAAASAGAVELWDVPGKKKLRDLKGHTLWVYGLAFSPDGRRMVTGGWDKTVRIWDPATGKELLSIDRYGAPIDAGIIYSPDGKTLALGGRDHTLRVWDANTGTERFVLRGHTRHPFSIAFSPDGRSLASGGADGSVKVWDVEAEGAAHTLRQNGLVMGAAFSPDGGRVATVAGDGIASIWDVARGTKLFTLDGKKGWLNAVAFHPEDDVIATACEYTAVQTWDARTGQLLRSFDGLDYYVRCVRYSSDGQLLAGCTGNHDYFPSAPGSVYVWDARSGELKHRFRGHPGRILCLAFSPDNRLIASGGSPADPRAEGGDEVLVWNATTGQVVHRLTGHRGKVNDVAFTADGKWLAAGCDDGTVRIWNMQNGLLVNTFDGSLGPVNSIAFNPDGSRLAVGVNENDIALWDPRTAEVITTLDGHEGGVASLQFNRDGTRLVSGSFDRTARLWDARPLGLSMPQGTPPR